MSRKLKNLKWAKLTDEAPKFKDRKPNRNQKRGLDYERKVILGLQKSLGEDCVLAHPWILYCDEAGTHFAQPDALIYDSKHRAFTIVEIKLSYRPEAAQKLRDFYGPLVRKVFRKRKLRFLQICKNLKPTAKDHTTHSLESGTKKGGPDYAVLQWRL